MSGTRIAYALVVETLTSDAAILLFSFVGLGATAVSIVRDARAQREQLVVTDNVRSLAAEDVRAEAA